MKKRIQYLAMFFTCLTIVLCTVGCSTQDTGQPKISSADRALAMWEVQNTMSKHDYYHAGGFHLEELADIWVKEDGPYAKTATFSNPRMIMQGLKTIKKLYGTDNQENKKKTLEALSKVYPELKNVPENLGAGGWYMHTLTTPIIQIADDGETAKGIWYSPGMGLNSSVKDGKVDVSGTFFWEKYGADFVKEDDRWKLWHIQMYYDFTPALDSKWTEIGGGPEGAPEAMERDQALPEGCIPNPVSYKPFSPTTVPVMLPKFPVPYHTFSETFSY